MQDNDSELKVIKNRNYNQAFTGEIGKLPPQAVDLEEAVLGALLIDREAVNDVIDILGERSFYKDAHQKIYKAIMNLFRDSVPIDILTVSQELKKNGLLEMVGGAYYISSLTERVGSSANIETHARIISQKHIQRELIRVSSNTIKKAYEDSTDVFDLLDEAEKSLFEVAEGNIRKDFDTMENLMKKAMIQIEEASKTEEGISGVPSGFTDLDKVTSGWQRSDLVIVAARPGMGKTAFVLSMARNIAVDFNRPLAVFSLEMPSVQLVLRLIASETGITSESIKKGNLKDHEWAQLHQNVEKLAKAPIFIDDTPALSIFELRAKCRRLKSQYDIQMVVIDYLQLMTAGGDSRGNREQEISQISRSLKSLAKELNVPVIALSQLSRAVETRGGDKKPQLSDLRESGAIEQDADMVVFLYRPQYYKIETFEDGSPTDGIGQVIIAKHRNGSLDEVNLRFIGPLAKFDNLEGEYDPGNNPISTNEAGEQFLTFGSKMNEDNPPPPSNKNFDDFFNSEDEPPF